MSRKSSRASMQSVKSETVSTVTLSGTKGTDGNHEEHQADIEVIVKVDDVEQKEEILIPPDEPIQVQSETGDDCKRPLSFVTGDSAPEQLTSTDLRRPFRASDVGILPDVPLVSPLSGPISDPTSSWKPMTQTGLRPGGKEILFAEHDEDEDESSLRNKLSSLCSCLVVLTVPVLLVTGVVLGMNGLDEEDETAKLGYTLLAVTGALILLCGCLFCCAPCIAILVAVFDHSHGSSVKHDPNSPIADTPLWVFKRINDRFYCDLKQHRRLLEATRNDLPPTIEEILKDTDKVAKRESRLAQVTGKFTAPRGKAPRTSAPLPDPAPQDPHAPETGPALQSRAGKPAAVSSPALEEAVRSAVAGGRTASQVREQLRPRTYLVRFRPENAVSDFGGMDPTQRFVSQTSLLIKILRPFDSVVVDIESPGGAVDQYGLLAQQLVRLKNKGVRVVACVDKVAASGGYMMACVADHIYAAPFAYVGSIGVVAMAPNLQRALEKRGVDVYVFTAGKYKRTVDVVGEVTEEGKAKFAEELNDIHHAFKEHVRLHRPQVDVHSVATGEAWIASQAKMKGLVDSIATCEEVLEGIAQNQDVLELVPFEKSKSSFLASLMADDGFGVQTMLNPLALGRAIRKALAATMASASPEPQVHRRSPVQLTAPSSPV